MSGAFVVGVRGPICDRDPPRVFRALRRTNNSSPRTAPTSCSIGRSVHPRLIFIPRYRRCEVVHLVRWWGISTDAPARSPCATQGRGRDGRARTRREYIELVNARGAKIRANFAAIAIPPAKAGWWRRAGNTAILRQRNGTRTPTGVRHRLSERLTDDIGTKVKSGDFVISPASPALRRRRRAALASRPRGSSVYIARRRPMVVPPSSDECAKYIDTFSPDGKGRSPSRFRRR